MLNNKPQMSDKDKYHQGLYIPKNKQKVIKLNDKGGFWYRSSWELKLLVYFDNKPEVVRWGCEIFHIPYVDSKGHPHRYFPDFYAEMQTDDPNNYKRMVIEVKPMKEVNAPVEPKNPTAKNLASFEYQVKLWEKNMHKWNFALEYCKSRGMMFLLVTEKHLMK